MLKEVYLIRHGETDYNRKGIVQGSGIDSELNDYGRLQARSFFDYYRDIRFDKIYTSELKRTQQTVEPFVEIGYSFDILQGFNEISWGYKEGRIPNSEDNIYYRNLISKWKEGQTHLASEGGESPRQVEQRQKKALDILLSRKNEKKILVATHGRAMRIFLCSVLGFPLSKMDMFPHQNTSLYKLNYDYDTQNFELICRNNLDHFVLIKD